CLKKDASVADNRPGVRIGEGHGVESVGALWKRVIGLFNPVVSTVCCSENDAGPAELEAANRSIIRVGERDSIESFRRSACLRRPASASIGCSENQASIADGGSGISIGKGNFEKTDASGVCLGCPCV